MAEVMILPAGVAQVELAAHAGINDLLEWIAEEAKRSAPVLTGGFRDSIHVAWDGETGSVISDSDHSAYVEFGTSDTPAHPTITPAFQAGLSHVQDIVGGAMAERLR